MGRDHILAVLEGGRAVISWGPSNESAARLSEPCGGFLVNVVAQVWANRTWAPVSLDTYTFPLVGAVVKLDACSPMQLVAIEVRNAPDHKQYHVFVASVCITLMPPAPLHRPVAIEARGCVLAWCTWVACW